MDIASSYDGLYLCTVADDRSMKVFDVVNFGMYTLCSCHRYPRTNVDKSYPHQGHRPRCLIVGCQAHVV